MGKPALFPVELHCNKDKASGVPPLLIYPVSLGAIKFVNIYLSNRSQTKFKSIDITRSAFQFT